MRIVEYGYIFYRNNSLLPIIVLPKSKSNMYSAYITMKQTIPVLYINGLGNGSIQIVDRLIAFWWQMAGAKMYYARVNWYDDEDIETKIQRVESQAQDLLKAHGGVVILGSSAGGSLALNVFYQLRNQNICVVCSRARLRVGKYEQSDRNSLYRRARLGTQKQSKSFYDSVVRVEDEIIPNLTKSDKQRVFIQSQLVDNIVPTNLMSIKGVSEQRSFAFDHFDGFLAHMFNGRNRTIYFAKSSLQSHNKIDY